MKAKKITPGKLVALATRVPKALHRAARLEAIATDTTLEAWMTDALARHLATCQGRATPAKSA